MVDEIDRGDRSPLDLDSLPRGVWQYYAQFWTRWQDQHADAWDAEQLPLLGTLGAIQEPATLPLLCTLADLSPHPRLRRLLVERWRPFLTVTDEEEPRYSVYHTSLREFLAGQLAPAERKQLTDTERHRLRELANATRQAHRRIIDRYLTRWGRLENNLPGLADPHRRSEDAGYGLRQLTNHLVAAGRPSDLHRLLACQWTQPAAGPDSALRYINAWYTAHDQTGGLAGYLRDVQLAWQLAQAATRHEIAAGGVAPSLGTETRYALITTSLVSLATSLPLPLIITLTTHGRWPPAQTLIYIRQLLNPADRASALTTLLPLLPLDQQSSVYEEALTAARQIGNEGRRAQLLVALAPHLPTDQQHQAWAEALTAARQIGNEGRRAEVLVALAPLVSALPASTISLLWQESLPVPHGVLGTSCWLISVSWCHCCRLQEGNRLWQLPLKQSSISADGGPDHPLQHRLLGRAGRGAAKIKLLRRQAA